jgi:hypothetical protein
VAVVCLTGFEGTSPLPSVSFSLAAFSAIHDIHNDDTSQQAGQKGRTAIDQFVFSVIVSFFFFGWSSTQKQAREAIKRADERSMYGRRHINQPLSSVVWTNAAPVLFHDLGT